MSSLDNQCLFSVRFGWWWLFLLPLCFLLSLSPGLARLLDRLVVARDVKND
jgi:lauroyl/myristoyl acyltransferase